MTCPNAAEALKEFCAANNTDVTVVMGMCVDGDLIRRDIAVFHLSRPEVAHKVCTGIFVMTLTFYHKIFHMIHQQSGVADDSKIEASFFPLCSINMIPRSVQNFVQIFGTVYAEIWVSEIQITQLAVL